MGRFSSGISPAALARAGIKVAKTKRKASKTAGKAAETALSRSLTLLKIAHEVQYPWGKSLSPPRKFHSDVAIPAARLLIEVDGQVHAISDKRRRDLERQNLGVKAGWRFLRYTPAEAENGTAALDVQKYLEGR